jgi:hypothetical protein
MIYCTGRGQVRNWRRDIFLGQREHNGNQNPLNGRREFRKGHSAENQAGDRQSPAQEEGLLRTRDWQVIIPPLGKIKMTREKTTKQGRVLMLRLSLDAGDKGGTEPLADAAE